MNVLLIRNCSAYSEPTTSHAWQPVGAIAPWRADVMAKCDAISERWLQPRWGCCGRTHPQYFGWGTSMGISPPILLRMFKYSRTILVVLAQLHHLMMSFIHCFARKSKICHRINPSPSREVMIKKNFKFSTSEFTKICHFTKQNVLPPRFLPRGEGVFPVGREHPSPHSTPPALHPPTLNSR